THGEAPREQSREEPGPRGKASTGKFKRVPKGHRGGPVTRCGRKTTNNCVVHINSNVKRGTVCQEFLSMYFT
ncbi:MAG: hypothetical protein ACKPKO_35930, partial [Candidatus Fonsibacter sp.]